MEIIKGALTAFLANNLASHTVGGFKQSMSFARHFCRSCFASKESSSNSFTADAFKLRSPNEHKRMCYEVNADPTNKKSTEYGINERSVLNDVYGFSVMGGLSWRLS